MYDEKVTVAVAVEIDVGHAIRPEFGPHHLAGREAAGAVAVEESDEVTEVFSSRHGCEVDMAILVEV